MATYRLPIEIEYALPNRPLVDYRKNFSFSPNPAGPDANLTLPEVKTVPTILPWISLSGPQLAR